MATSLHDVQNKALETAQRFVDYESYRASEARAVSALHKRCDGWSKEECRGWFGKSVIVHRHGISFVQAHADAAFEAFDRDRNDIDFKPIAVDFLSAHPEFPEDLLLGVLAWVFYWYHLR